MPAKVRRKSDRSAEPSENSQVRCNQDPSVTQLYSQSRQIGS